MYRLIPNTENLLDFCQERYVLFIEISRDNHIFNGNERGQVMQLVVKLFISLSIIVLCTRIGKSFPSLAGLIATMPLTGLIVLMWLYIENKNYPMLEKYTQGALWGIVPSILFFLTAYFCMRKHLSFPFTILLSFGIWSIGAFIHQWLLR